mmetsp:Transcript_76634/g.216835  ORF Transcript_76634/g.216835 Transcript_76634/m.216835 type:complete len:229 (-) Transcript_76634:263-949(-)
MCPNLCCDGWQCGLHARHRPAEGDDLLRQVPARRRDRGLLHVDEEPRLGPQGPDVLAALADERGGHGVGHHQLHARATGLHAQLAAAHRAQLLQHPPEAGRHGRDDLLHARGPDVQLLELGPGVEELAAAHAQPRARRLLYVRNHLPARADDAAPFPLRHEHLERHQRGAGLRRGGAGELAEGQRAGQQVSLRALREALGLDAREGGHGEAVLEVRRRRCPPGALALA